MNLRVFAGLVVSAMIVMPAGARQADTVDAATFLLAFRDGKADQFKGRTVTGSGRDFTGSAPKLNLVVGAAGDGASTTPVTTWDQFRAAQDARTTLLIALDAASFKRTTWPKREQPVDEYTFSGVFRGVSVTVPRTGSTSAAPDSGPCGGSLPPNVAVIGNSGTKTFHCIPVLEEATIQKR